MSDIDLGEAQNRLIEMVEAEAQADPSICRVCVGIGGALAMIAVLEASPDEPDTQRAITSIRLMRKSMTHAAISRAVQ